jgi:N-acetyl-anhydromuramyl-L-alanine amidase AmpD
MAHEIERIPAHPENYGRGRDGQHANSIVNHIAEGSMAGIIQHFLTARPENPTSAHFAVGKDGRIVQFVPLSDTAYSNGRLAAPNYAAVPWLRDAPWPRPITANSFTVSIEWEGAHIWSSGIGSTVLRWWKPTEPQYQAGLWLHRHIIAECGIAVDRAHITRHSDFNSSDGPSGRRWCPGFGFDLARLLGDLGDPEYAKAATPAPTTYRVTGPPTVSLPVFEQFLRTRQSPLLAERPAFEYYNAVTAAGVDPNFALAMWWHEGQAGKDGAAARNRNIGNLRPRRDGTIGRAVDISFDYFRMYRNWLDGVRDWAELLGGPAYRDHDVRTAIGTYAPASDGNVPEAYVRAVLSIMAALAEASDKGGGGG